MGFNHIITNYKIKDFRMSDDFGKRISIEEVEEGTSFMPKFDEKGLIPV